MIAKLTKRRKQSKFNRYIKSIGRAGRDKDLFLIASRKKQRSKYRI